MIAQKINFNDYFDESYAKFRDHKVWGNYGMFATPQLVINDLDLMKDVMIKVNLKSLHLLPIFP